jgi:hypothetical protein
MPLDVEVAEGDGVAVALPAGVAVTTGADWPPPEQAETARARRTASEATLRVDIPTAYRATPPAPSKTFQVSPGI